MKIPKYIQNLIIRREKLANKLMNVSSELDEWLENKVYLSVQAIVQQVV